MAWDFGRQRPSGSKAPRGCRRGLPAKDGYIKMSEAVEMYGG